MRSASPQSKRPPTPIRLRPYPERALSATWEPAAHHTIVGRELSSAQLARIRSGFDGTTASLRTLAAALGLPFYVVRECALAMGKRNPARYQPPRKRYSRGRASRAAAARAAQHAGQEVAS